MIEARNVSISIGRKAIIGNVDFIARPGEFTAIIGPNGSGKSTLLKALSGDLAYTGHVAINGSEVAGTKPWQAAAMRAVLPQATVLSFPFTVREVVRLGLLGGRSGALQGEEQRLPERALARVDLEGFAGRYYQELSGGEQQRVQLARVLCQVWAPVLAGAPRYFLLDEPVSNLDIKHQLVIMNVAREFARRGGGSVAASGAPEAVLRDATIAKVFDCPLKVGALPSNDVPFILPQSAA